MYIRTYFPITIIKIMQTELKDQLGIILKICRIWNVFCQTANDNFACVTWAATTWLVEIGYVYFCMRVKTESDRFVFHVYFEDYIQI